MATGCIPAAIAGLVIPEPNSGCWLWMGRVNEKGYGLSSHGLAHRFVLRLVGREVKPPLEVDHLCRVRCCVNPLHLEAVTHKENLARKPVSQTCPQGHVRFSIRNGKRRCLDCGLLRNLRAYEARSKHQRNGRRWLSADEKAGIRSAIGLGLSHSKIGVKFRVSIATVSRLRNSA